MKAINAIIAIGAALPLISLAGCDGAGQGNLHGDSSLVTTLPIHIAVENLVDAMNHPVVDRIAVSPAEYWSVNNVASFHSYIDDLVQGLTDGQVYIDGTLVAEGSRSAYDSNPHMFDQLLTRFSTMGQFFTAYGASTGAEVTVASLRASLKSLDAGNVGSLALATDNPCAGFAELASNFYLCMHNTAYFGTTQDGCRLDNFRRMSELSTKCTPAQLDNAYQQTSGVAKDLLDSESHRKIPAANRSSGQCASDRHSGACSPSTY